MGHGRISMKAFGSARKRHGVLAAVLLLLLAPPLWAAPAPPAPLNTAAPAGAATSGPVSPGAAAAPTGTAPASGAPGTKMNPIPINPGATMNPNPVTPMNTGATSSVQAALLVIYFVVCASLVLCVLLQTSKNEGLSGTLGGNVQSVFRGKAGTEEQLGKLTTGLAVTFVLLSFLMQILVFQH